VTCIWVAGGSEESIIFIKSSRDGIPSTSVGKKVPPKGSEISVVRVNIKAHFKKHVQIPHDQAILKILLALSTRLELRYFHP
jgi:hypothetical protein